MSLPKAKSSHCKAKFPKIFADDFSGTLNFIWDSLIGAVHPGLCSLLVFVLFNVISSQRPKIQ
jgi:hypothetical protein